MTRVATRGRRGSYGVDAPYAAAFLAAVFALYLALASFEAVTNGRVRLFPPVLILAGIVSSFFYTTRRGKFIVWADLLDRLNLRGDERILDLGCGRGAVLLLAAQHLTTGRAVGVDLWRGVDQSGNSAEATQRNAVAEGVADRIELQTGDMTALPFADDSFDVIVSSLALHNIWGSASRAQAIREAVRALRPGGRMLIADVRATQPYPAQLTNLGMQNVARRRLGWRFWWGGPWAPTRLVTATKPQPQA